MLKKSILTAILILSSFHPLKTLAGTAYTGPSASWSYSNYDNGSYVAKTGNLSSAFYESTNW